MVVIQVLLQTKEYGMSKRDHWVFPKSSEISFGWSLVLAWSVFLINVSAGLIFMLYSKKRKRDRANPHDEFAMADEPTIIGR